MNMMTITSTENKRAAVIQAAAAALALRVKSATIKIIEGQLQKKVMATLSKYHWYLFGDYLDNFRLLQKWS